MEKHVLLLNSKAEFEARFNEIEKEREALKAQHANNPDKLAEIEKAMNDKVYETVSAWERFKVSGLLKEARKYNIDLPTDKDAWVGMTSPVGYHYLSDNGILTLRRAIDEEKTRRREVSAWWWKTVIIPALAAITGIIGALTGLFAVLNHK